MILANTQRSVGIVVALVLVAAWLLYIVTNLRKARHEIGSEIELAPNRKPYLDDEELEGPKLDRALRWGVITLIIVAVGLPLYWLREPTRQIQAEAMFEERAKSDDLELAGGAALFATTEEGGFNCAGCHGPEGVGGVTSFAITDPETEEVSVVQWTAPPLNDVLLRFDAEEVRRVIVYGRKGTPMPAWGLEGGGPLNDEQVNNIVAYIEDIQISEDEAKQRAQESLEQAMAEGDDIGEALFNGHCARCHTLGWSYGDPGEPGGGAFGPPMTNVRDQFPLEEDHAEFIRVGSDFEVQYGVRGIGSGRMPGFGAMLTDEMIDAIVDYERSLARR
jgi:mono/diheme cytochrome c family protein